MDAKALERALRDLPRHGRVVKDYAYRQVWRVEIDGRAYYLKFYPKQENRWRRLVRGSSAMREFLRLQWLQKAGIPAARAASVLMGLTIDGRKGDAVLIEAIEPSVSLRELAQQAHQSAKPLPKHRDLVAQVIAILKQMGSAKLGHTDLHLGNFLVKEGKVYLIDAYPLHQRGLKTRDVMNLASSASEVATRTDLWRTWMSLAGVSRMPRTNPQAQRVYRKQMSRIYRSNRYFARLAAGAWSGVAFKRSGDPRRWARVSGMQFEAEAWQQAWGKILALIESDQFTMIKTSRSGDVMEGQIIVGGRPVEVVIKRPRRRRLSLYLTDILRGTRARRAWRKSWQLIHRGIPCAWPVLLMERRVLGYVTDAVIVFERIRGEGLESMDLDALSRAERQALFHRAGATLRRMEAGGMHHWDAKGANWMVLMDVSGPTPMLVDMDGIRRSLTGEGEGLRRMLESMREHPQYTPEDSLNLCRGYAPFAPMGENEAPEDQGDS